MADRDTPFIFNEWYVAAFSEEIGRALTQRMILGKRVVLYRTEAGEPVALEDRCAHRSYPLSSGKIEGDTVVCGYHGFRYNPEGDCIEVPSVAECPAGIGVACYPTVERGSVVWIWMGEPDRADPSTIHDLTWTLSPAWASAHAYYSLQSSYVYLHENLLDTSHLTYMHPTTIGSPDYVKAPTRTEMGEGRFALIRTVSPTRLPPLWATLTGLDGIDTAARIVRNEFFSPGAYEATTSLYDGALPEEQRPEFHIKVAHLITPETQHTAHYFIVVARDFAVGDAGTTKVMTAGFCKAFEEDVVGLALLESRLRELGDDNYEMSVASDTLGVAMRFYLKTRAEEEAKASAAPMQR